MYDLSQREQEILHYICRGLNNKEIAQILFVSPNTIKAQVSTILKKFGVDNRTIVAYIASCQDLIENNQAESTVPCGTGAVKEKVTCD